MEQFKNIDFSQMEETCRQAIDEDKFVYIADQTGDAAEFFYHYEHAWELYDFHKHVYKAMTKPNQWSHRDAAEELRKQIVKALKFGKQLVIDLDSMCPQIKRDHDYKSILPLSDFILKSRSGLIEDSKKNKRIIKPEEDKDDSLET